MNDIYYVYDFSIKYNIHTEIIITVIQIIVIIILYPTVCINNDCLLFQAHNLACYRAGGVMGPQLLAELEESRPYLVLWKVEDARLSNPEVVILVVERVHCCGS